MTKKIFLFGLILSVMISYSAMAGVADSNQVIIRLVSSDIITFPSGKSEAPINEVEFSSSSLRNLLTATGAEKIAKAYPNYTEVDTTIIDFAGQTVIIGDLTRTIVVGFETKQHAGNFLQQVKTPASLKEEMNLMNQIIEQKNLGNAPISVITKEIAKDIRIQELRKRYRRHPEISWAEPNYPGQPYFAPNDPRLPLQWNLPSSCGINALRAWDFETQTQWPIAILDDGIHAHRDISFTGYQTFFKAHGLACAGIAGAKTNNGLDMAGIAWNTNFGSFDANSFSPGGIAGAIYDAMGYGIMNISGGGLSESFELGTAVRVAMNNGKLLCCASGNEGVSYPAYPAYWAFAVGATKKNKQVPSWSNRNPDLVAPGGKEDGDPGPDDILSLWYEDPYYSWWRGTSLSAPHAAGVAGILSREYSQEQSYSCTRSDLEKLMEKTAYDIYPSGYDASAGWGLIDAGSALNKIQKSGNLRIKRESASGYSSYTESGAYAMTLVEVGNLATQTYLVKKNTMYRNVNWNHPCQEVPWAWTNEQYTNGFSSMNPQYGTKWGDVVDGSVTTTVATLYTQIYHVWDFEGVECGWYPCERHQVSYNYSVLGRFNMFAPYDAVSQLIYDGGTSHYIRIMFSDTNEYHDGYQLSISHECGSATINLAKDCHLYNYYCPWGSVNVIAKIRPYIGSDYGPWSNVTTTRNAPNIPSNLRVSLKVVCGWWPAYTKVAFWQLEDEALDEALNDGQIEEIWVPADTSLNLTTAPEPGHDPPCFATNWVKVRWDTPEYQHGEPDYYEIRVQMPTVPIQVYYVGPEYGHEREFCTWPDFGPQRISVLAWKYGLHSNETEEGKSITSGFAVCSNYPFGKGPPPDYGPDPSIVKSHPDEFSLYQNYPNPFNPETDIAYNLPQDCMVKLTIYNMLGQKVKVLADEQQMAGFKTVHWDGKDQDGNEVSSGIYFYRLQAGEYDEVRKMILMK